MLQSVAKRYWRHGVAPAVLLCVAIVLCRGIWSPGIITFDDLLPLQTTEQLSSFMFSDWNDFYQRPEMRAQAGFFWVWLRWHPLMRIGLVFSTILLALGAYVLTLRLIISVSRPRVTGVKEHSVAVCAAIYYLLFALVSMAHQLSTIYIGMALLPWTLVCMLRGLEADSRRWAWPLVAGVLLMVNPSPHIQLLLLLLLPVMLVVLLGARVLRLRHALSGFLLFCAPWIGFQTLTVLPTLAAGLLEEVVPVRWAILRAQSRSLLEAFLLPIDKSVPLTHQTGQYTFAPQLLRSGGITSAVLVVHVLLAVGAAVRRRTPLILGLMAMYLLTALMATGVEYDSNPYQLMFRAAEIPMVGVPMRYASMILRTPSRWLLMGSLLVAALSAIGIHELMTQASKIAAGKKRALTSAVCALCAAIYLAPFALETALHPVWSGDLGGALKPMPVPAHWQAALEHVDGAMTLYLPIVGGRQIVWEGDRRKVTDELFCLLHGGPSIEGDSGSSLMNQRYVGYMYYYLLYERKSANIGRYLNLIGIEYVVFHDDLLEAPYYHTPHEFARVLDALLQQRDLELIYVGGGVNVFRNLSFQKYEMEPARGLILYRGTGAALSKLLEEGVTPPGVVLLRVDEGDLDWHGFKSLLSVAGDRTVLFDKGDGNGMLLDLISSNYGTRVFFRIDPLSPKQQSDWRDQVYLNATTIGHRRFFDRYGVFGIDGALEGKIVATDVLGAEVTAGFSMKRSGVYEVYIRAAAPRGEVTLRVTSGGVSQDLVLRRTEGFGFWKVGEFFLGEGNQSVSVELQSARQPVVLNMVYVIDRETRERLEEDFGDLVGNLGVTVANDVKDVVDWYSVPKERVDALSYSNVSFYRELRRLDDGEHCVLRAWLIAAAAVKR